MIEKYGKEKAERMTRLMLKNYKRLVFINTGVYEIERYQECARNTAEKFNLHFEEIDGSPALVKKMVFGPWDDEFVVVNTGEAVTYRHFTRS